MEEPQNGQMLAKLDETNDILELLRLNNDQLGILLRALGRFDPAAVYVFGSRAQGTSGPQSDLDVAFLSSQPCDVWEVYLASQELSSLLGLEVELLDLRRASTVMRKEVIRTGRCIARVRPNEVSEFEMYTLSNYARLNEERAPVLRAIADETITMPEDTQLNKADIIRRCLERIRDEYGGQGANLENWTKQDAIVLNLLRACEAAIDLAMHEVAERRLGIPQASRDAFAMLEQAGVITSELSRRMQAMVGFRNIAVHSYQQIQLPILSRILDDHLEDFEAFLNAILGSKT